MFNFIRKKKKDEVIGYILSKTTANGDTVYLRLETDTFSISSIGATSTHTVYPTKAQLFKYYPAAINAIQTLRRAGIKADYRIHSVKVSGAIEP